MRNGTMERSRICYTYLTSCICLILLVSATTANETRKFTLPDSLDPILFGWSAALEGNRAVIGDPGQRLRAGAAHVLDISTGQVQQTLTPSNRRVDDLFGFDLDVSGNLVAVGTPANPFVRNPLPGAVSVFDINSGSELRTIRPMDSQGGDEFGFSTALDGSLLAVGAPHLGLAAGKAYLFEATSGNELFSLQPEDPMVGNEFGWDLDVAGDYVVVGSPATFDEDDPEIYPGAAYVFDSSTGSQLTKLVADSSHEGDEFGFSIGISGNKAIIGAPDGAGTSHGSAYIFDLSTGTQLHRLRPSDSRVDDDFGSAVDIYGNIAAVGARGQGTVSGAVYLFDVRTGAELARLEPSDLDKKDKFGSAVALFSDKLLVGSPQDIPAGKQLITGSAYLFDLDFGLLGDFDNDGQLTPNDIDLLTNEVISGANNTDFDLNSDGAVDQQDRIIWVEELANTFFGDSNFDGQFGTGDLVRVFAVGEYEDGVPNNSTWAEGDWNGDHEFDSGDLIFVFQRAEYETGPRRNANTVPEPSAFLLIASSALLLLGPGRNRRR